jgi:hypothetical protein
MSMKTIKVSEATGPALDWLVAKCEGLEPFTNTPYDGNSYTHGGRCFVQRYSSNWYEGGPIIYRELIATSPEGGTWVAVTTKSEIATHAYGPTPLIAAMRCYVTSKLGDTAEVPEELL